MALESNGDRPLKEEQLDANEPTVIAKIHLPEFDPDDIETWFICLEAAFSVNAIKNDKYKFNAVINALGSRAKYVHSVITKCNATNTNDKYDVLKAAAIAHFRPSESQRLTSLLSEMTLEDQKPSVLLSEMRRLDGVGCTDSVLTNLWLRALLHTTCSIIAAMPAATLDEQAKMADKILEAPREQISAVQVAESSSISSLEQRIEALSRRLDEALSCEFRGRDRHNSRPRDRSFNRREGTPARSKTPRRWICWFHYKHDAEARKCEKTKSDNPNVKCIFFDGRVEVYTRPKEN
ncbi:uncharacterized protein LOC129728728 [Wyeomyia smithii]|uniref:uncharacterized protein LOC129728728 n=1 Tax=Wyeomyia smithii TaxID=174621 RepID=UPI002467DFF8|nr:uncharacterized protein LOC129728728 [Wyeomyia smithii]